MSAKQRAIAVFIAVISSCWAQHAAALDRGGAIEAARKEVGDKCKDSTACTFTAKAEGKQWHVRVDFPRAARSKPSHRDHAIFIIGPTGKIVGRIEGKK
jgi:hypothetical protein